jgi:hypothetical protein
VGCDPFVFLCENNVNQGCPKLSFATNRKPQMATTARGYRKTALDRFDCASTGLPENPIASAAAIPTAASASPS